MPPHHSPDATPVQRARLAASNAMGPSHNAIVLSGSELSRRNTVDEATEEPGTSYSLWRDADRGATESPYIAQERRIMRTIVDVREARRRMEDNLASNAPPADPIRRTGSALTPSQSRRAMLEANIRARRDDNTSTESSTSIGRLVAARTGGVSRSISSAVSNRFTTLTADAARRALELANDSERDSSIRTIAEHNARLSRLVQDARSTRSVASTSTTETDSGTERETDTQSSASQTNSGWRAVPSQPQSFGEQRWRRRSRRPAEGSTTLIVSSQISPSEANASDASTGETSYRMRQHLNVDSEEFVHNVTPSESDRDDPYNWLMSREELFTDARRGGRLRLPPRDRYSSTTHDIWTPPEIIRRRERDPQSSTSQGSTRAQGTSTIASSSRSRRRGWARLDQDGNEIPTDEEDEYERNRALMRARALQLAGRQAPVRLERAPPPIPPPPLPEHRLSFIPTTQSMLRSPPGESNARVRINSMPWAAIPSAHSDVNTPFVPQEEVDEDEPPPVIGSSRPFVPSLLPLPSVDMSSKRLSQQHVKSRMSIQPIQVQEGFAGR
ncbi:hypothetical protein IEO21_03441 [Rhodonia placenta]|uniref:Uncharacterized protein n=1 Tax=Rhodonia placenta TaxID=104341 RepID=A0A8H7P630_9APHY|nr:hypothetical protein IEO21_03441 [Postia placenta]